MCLYFNTRESNDQLTQDIRCQAGREAQLEIRRRGRLEYAGKEGAGALDVRRFGLCLA